MSGLSVVLEAQKVNTTTTSSTSPKTTPHVINKVITIKSPSSTTTTSSSSPKPPPPIYYPSSSFLQRCFLCQKNLLPSEDIYMYLGEKAFCSVDCRYTQICRDEKLNSPSTSTSATASAASRHTRKAKWPQTTASAPPVFFA